MPKVGVSGKFCSRDCYKRPAPEPKPKPAPAEPVMLRQHDYTTKVKIRGSKQPTEDELRIAAEKEERRDRLEQAAERAKSQSRPRRQIELVGARAYPPEPPVELEPVPLPETSGLLQSSLGGAAYREE